MLLSPSFYAHVTHSLKGLANGRVAVVLEGGYCIESLADGAAYTLRSLLGDPPVPVKMRYPLNDTVVDSILDVISVHRPHWAMLRLQRTFNRHEPREEGFVDLEENPRRRHLPMIEYRGQVELLPERPSSYPTRDCYPVQAEHVRAKYANAIEILRANADAQYASTSGSGSSGKRTAFIRMAQSESRRHRRPFPAHPERPTRISFLVKSLKAYEGGALLGRLHHLEGGRLAEEEAELRLAHSPEALEAVRRSGLYAGRENYQELRAYERLFDSVYLTAESYQVARLAAGSVLQVVDAVLGGACLNGFAAVRPPGHHASRDRPAGFCLFNNVAIAARYALKKYSKTVKRVLILDWDVHHGDGTQDIVAGDERMLFVSLHRYDQAVFYPEKMAANYNIGRNVVNIPWSGGPMGDREYLAAFCNVVLPVAYNFSPDLVLVSAGFDAAIGKCFVGVFFENFFYFFYFLLGDPLGEYCLSPNAYGQMTHMLGALANGRMILTLEVRSFIFIFFEKVLIFLIFFF